MRHGRWRFLLGALVPALVLHVVFVLSPYAQAFYLSLTDWSGVSGEAQYVGAGNYARLGGDSLFLDAVRNNAVMLVVVPLVTIALGLGLASLLRTRRGASAFTYGRFGYASAMGVALFFATLTLAVLALRAGRRERLELA